MQKPDRQTMFLGSAVLCVLSVASYLGFFYGRGDAESQLVKRPQPTLDAIPVDGRRAYRYLNQICDLGRRPSGSAGMARQQELLTRHFQALGGQVKLQEFAVRHPVDGSRVPLANLIVEWHPERRERILLCAHYDTRPFPDRDRRNPRGTFVGANDGGSGVAALMELGHYMRDLDGRYGVDFVFFDAEEFIFDPDRDKYFLGSEYFARDYVANRPEYRYRAGILLDMVGDSQLHIYQERISLRHARSLVRGIWNVADRLGVDEFIHRSRYQIRDDHLALNEIARIPTCDIIDFDYPRPRAQSYWHTEADTPDKCSPLSLAKVGWVVLEWLKSVQEASQ